MSRQLAMELAANDLAAAAEQIDAGAGTGRARDIWEVIAQVPRYDVAGAPPLYIAARGQGDAERFVLVQQIGAEWRRCGPVVSFDLFYQTAELVVGRDPRAATWPQALMVLATGACVMLALAKRQAAGHAPPSSPDEPPGAAEASLSAGHSPPAAASMPDAAAGGLFDHCGCGG